MSPRHFARVFRKETGLTPGRFVENARVESARALLEGSPIGVKEAASRGGFGSADSMRRAFLRVLGVTPAEYAGRLQKHRAAR